MADLPNAVKVLTLNTPSRVDLPYTMLEPDPLTSSELKTRVDLPKPHSRDGRSSTLSPRLVAIIVNVMGTSKIAMQTMIIARPTLHLFG